MVSALEDRILDLAEAKLRLKAKAKQRSRIYVDDPVGHIEKRQKEFIWSKQKTIAQSVVTHKRTAVHACHAPGKSFLAARIAAWWIDAHEAGEAFVVTTAPTFPQVRAILWREIRRAHNRAKLPGRVNQTEWILPVDGSDELVAFGRKPADYDEAAFQGIHARYVLVIMDEAAGIPADLWNAVESITTNDDARILAIGNPDDPSSVFASKCAPDSQWNTIHISAFDTPNFTDEPFPDELRPYLVTPGWVKEQEAEHGKESPWYQSRVLGQFPDNAEATLVPISWAQACRYGDGERPEIPDNPVIQLGVDVGETGDETSVCLRYGQRAIMKREWHGRTPDPDMAVGMIMRVAREWKPTKIKVDAIGVGWGLQGSLRRELKDAGIKCQVVPVKVSEGARRKEKYPRLRDELWWEVGRELTREQAWDLTDVPETCIGQLVAPKYAIDTSGRTKVEKKEETKKRLGRSPDLADALLLAFYDAPGAAESIRF